MIHPELTTAQLNKCWDIVRKHFGVEFMAKDERNKVEQGFLAFHGLFDQTGDCEALQNRIEELEYTNDSLSDDLLMLKIQLLK